MQLVLDMCADGRPECVDVTIASMRQRFESLARVCDHDCVFALAYLRTTQTYKWARDQPGFFADTAWVNHEDAVFAEYYFAARDNWAAGRREAVPEAWSIAFDAARTREVTGAGDLFAAGFLVGLARGADYRTSARLGALVAAEVIQHLGARPEISLKELARDNGFDV